jgi:hypothetical protein
MLFGNAQLATGLVPTGAIEQDHGMCAGRYLTADFGQMQVHRKRQPSAADIARAMDGPVGYVVACQGSRVSILLMG